MTRLLAVILFVCSTAATQASTDIEIEDFKEGDIIKADAFNVKNKKITNAVNGNKALASSNSASIISNKNAVNANTALAKTNTNSITTNALEISGLTTKVNSCLVLPSGCTAGQSITFDGSALVCADILPTTCSSYQTIIYDGGAWVCTSG